MTARERADWLAELWAAHVEHCALLLLAIRERVTGVRLT